MTTTNTNSEPLASPFIMSVPRSPAKRLLDPVRALLLLVFAAWSSLASADTLDANLKSIKAVQNLGKGNVVAGRAWQAVAQAEVVKLPVILAAMDDATPLALNWLHAAVDSIAERELRQGGKLPAAELEEFAKNQKHGARARRLAFDWLTRVDPTTPDRLIPDMLNDPGLEFRRDAVTRLIEQAQEMEKANQADAAVELYQKAFSHARDFDQIKQLSDKLVASGRKIDLAQEMGFVLEWKLIGPFDNTDLKGFDVEYPPEAEINAAASYDGKTAKVAWINYETSDELGLVDLNKAIGKANGVAGYAVAEFSSPTARDVELRLGSGNASKLWLNGELLSHSSSYHANDGIDQFVGKGRLKQGRNVILLKILQNEQKESWAQKWEFQLRVCDSLGTAILSPDRKPRKPAPAPDAAASLNK